MWSMWTYASGGAATRIYKYWWVFVPCVVSHSKSSAVGLQLDEDVGSTCFCKRRNVTSRTDAQHGTGSASGHGHALRE